MHLFIQEEQLIQKRIKRENAYEVNIVRSFPGGYCKSISFGIRTWIWQPWTDESRIAVKVCSLLQLFISMCSLIL